MWISWITAGSEEDICLLNYQCYSLYTFSIVIPLVRQIYQMKIAEIRSQTSVAEDIDVYLGPEIIQPLTKSCNDKLCIYSFLDRLYVLPYEASITF